MGCTSNTPKMAVTFYKWGRHIGVFKNKKNNKTLTIKIIIK